MAVSLIMLIILSVIFALVLTAAAAVVYIVIYNARANKRLNSNTESGHRMPAPLTITIIIFLVTLIIFFSIFALGFLFSFNTADSLGSQIDDNYFNSYYSINGYSLEEASENYLANYINNDFAGFESFTETTDDFVFTYYLSEDSYDSCHPAFIIKAEYTGSSDITSWSYNGEFLTESGETITGFGAGGMDISDCYYFAGNTCADCGFHLSLCLYNDKDWQSMMENAPHDTDTAMYATATGSLQISIEREE